MATASVNRASVSVIVDGEDLSVKQWVVQEKVLTALVMVYVCLLHNSVIALTGGREQAVIYPTALECQIAMRLVPAMEESIHQSA